MGKLEISEVKLSEAIGSTGTSRWDTEYYLKEYFHMYSKLKKFNCTTLKSFSCFIKKGIFDLSPDYYKTKGIPLIRTSEIKSPLLDFSSTVYLDKKNHEENRNTTLYPNDLVFTKIGAYIGDVSLCPFDFEEYNFSQNVAGVSLTSKKNGPYLLSFFLSKYGKKQIIRSAMLSGQGKLELEEIRNYLIPLLPETFQNTIAKMVQDAHAALEQSKSLYNEAEHIFETELGINPSLFEQEKAVETSVRNFKEVFANSARIDAEYYQNKYDELEKIVRHNCNDVRQISELSEFNARGTQPEYVSYGDLNVINSKHILEDGLDYGNFERTDISAWQVERSRVFYGDILVYTTGANIGRTAVYLIQEKAVASNHVNILRLKNVNTIYAGFVLNSKIGRIQTERMCSGTAQVELYPKDIEKFYIPLLPSAVQTKIAEKIQQSFALRTQSKQLLQDAKHLVESEIEKGGE